MAKKVDKNSMEYLLEWQNVLMPGNNKALVLSKKQLQRKTVEQIERDNIGIKAAHRVLKDATDVHVFFENFYQMTEAVEHIKLLTKYHKLSGERAIDKALKEMNMKKDTAVKNFLTRSFDKAKADAAEVETEEPIKEWEKSLMPYKDKMNDENLAYIDELLATK